MSRWLIPTPGTLRERTAAKRSASSIRRGQTSSVVKKGRRNLDAVSSWSRRWVRASWCRFPAEVPPQGAGCAEAMLRKRRGSRHFRPDLAILHHPWQAESVARSRRDLNQSSLRLRFLRSCDSNRSRDLPRRGHQAPGVDQQSATRQGKPRPFDGFRVTDPSYVRLSRSVRENPPERFSLESHT